MHALVIVVLFVLLGDVDAAPPLPTPTLLQTGKAGDSVEQIFTTISKGLPNTRMVGYPQLKETDRWGLAYYVRTFRLSKSR